MDFDPKDALDAVNALLRGEVSVDALPSIVGASRVGGPTYLAKIVDFYRTVRGGLMSALSDAANSGETEKLLAVNDILMRLNERMQKMTEDCRMIAEAERRAVEDASAQSEPATSDPGNGKHLGDLIDKFAKDTTHRQAVSMGLKAIHGARY